MANRITATLKHAGFFCGALGLAVSLPMANKALAAPGFEYLVTDTASNTVLTNGSGFVLGTTGVGPTGNITGDGWNISLTFNTNFPGTTVAGTMSTQATLNSTLSTTLDPISIAVFVSDSATPNTKATFTLPTGTGFSLLGGSSFTTNATLSAGTMVGKDFANATSVTSPTFGVGGGSSSSSIGLSSLSGYTLENDITLNGLTGAGGADFSSIVAQTSSSVQTVSTSTPEPATLAILGVGLVGLRFVRRRRARS